METFHVPSYETGAFIQLTLLDAVLNPAKDIDRYVRGCFSNSRVERSTRHSGALFNLQAPLLRSDQQTTKICLLVSLTMNRQGA